MLFKSVLPAAGLLVSSSHAFLLPPGMSLEAVDFPPHADAQSLTLDCPGCLSRVGKSDGASSSDASHLELEFTIDAVDGVDHLSLNGFELYPKANPYKTMLTAPLLPGSADDKDSLSHEAKDTKEHTQTLGYGLHTHRDPPTYDNDLELVTVDLQIVEIGNVFINGIQGVKVRLIKSLSGKLMIGSIEATKAPVSQETLVDKIEECQTMVCRWKTIVKNHLASFKGKGKPCAHHMPPAESMGADHGVAAPQVGGQDPAPASGHHHSAAPWYRHQHSWGQLMKNIASHILLPVAIGILAGVTASLLGMLVGTCIVYVWRTCVRGSSASRRHGSRRGRGSSFKVTRRDNGDVEEKVGLMAEPTEELAPPAYFEDAAEDEEEDEPAVVTEDNNNKL
jgi:hypothetical protein